MAVRPERPLRLLRPLAILLSVLCLAGLYLAGRGGTEDPGTQFGKGVLQDGVVTPQEYGQANDAVVRCGKSKNVVFTQVDRYGIVIFSSSRLADLNVLNECDTGDVGLVRSLYEDRYKDPRREGDEVYYRCLETVGLISASKAARAEPLSQLVNRLVNGPATSERSALADRCMYDPTGRSWKHSPSTAGPTTRE